MTSVLVVILNWNGIEDTLRCLLSLQQQTYKNFKIAVVDNGSSDSSIERLLEISEGDNNIILIRNGRNLGFAGGVNTGIKYALNHSFDAVVLLNNDAVADKSWLENLVNAVENTDASIITGLLLRSDGKSIDSTGDFFSIWGMSFPRNRNKSPKTAPQSGYIFGATGGASIYKTSLFRDIGLFDEAFFAYYEDADMSFRAQLAGYKVYYTKDAVAYHAQGATSNKIPGFTTYQTFKNLPLLFWKNIPTKFLLIIGMRFLFLYTLIFGNAVKNGSGWPALKGFLASVYYFWTSTLWKRFKIQRNKRSGSDYLWSIFYHDLPPEQTGMRKLRKFFTRKG